MIIVNIKMKTMKIIKTKRELESESLKLYGGLNKNLQPFNIGDKIKQIYRLDDNDNLIKDGREEYEFIGMKGDVMLIKPLNTFALYGEDIMNKKIISKSKEMGYNPSLGNDIKQLHYKYADRFMVV
jgi:hypothetical protein